MKKFGTPTGTAPGNANDAVGFELVEPVGAVPVSGAGVAGAERGAGRRSRGWVRGGACWQPVVADRALDVELTTPLRRAASSLPVEARRDLGHLLVAGSSSVAGGVCSAGAGGAAGVAGAVGAGGAAGATGAGAVADAFGSLGVAGAASGVSEAAAVGSVSSLSEPPGSVLAPAGGAESSLEPSGAGACGPAAGAAGAVEVVDVVEVVVTCSPSVWFSALAPGTLPSSPPATRPAMHNASTARPGVACDLLALALAFGLVSARFMELPVRDPGGPFGAVIGGWPSLRDRIGAECDERPVSATLGRATRREADAGGRCQPHKTRTLTLSWTVSSRYS